MDTVFLSPSLMISIRGTIAIIIVTKEAAGINCHGAHPRVIVFAHAEVTGICNDLAQFVVTPIGKIVIAVITSHIERRMLFFPRITGQHYRAINIINIFPKRINGIFVRLGRLICVWVNNLNRVCAGTPNPNCILVSQRVVTLAERTIKRNGNPCRACLFGVDIDLQTVCAVPISALPFSNDNILMPVLRVHFHNIRITGNSLCSAICHCIVRSVGRV